MLTAHNYPHSTVQLDAASLPPYLQEAHEWLLQSYWYYDKSEIVKRVADKAIAQLNQYMKPSQKATAAKPIAKKSDEAKDDAIEFLEVLLSDAEELLQFAKNAEEKELQKKEMQQIEEAIEFIKML